MAATNRPPEPPWIQLFVVGVLSAYFIIGAVAWVIFAYEGRPFPESFQTILATIAGGLVGVLTSPSIGRPSPGDGDGGSGASS